MARGTFSNRLGFILAAAGSAVGLGNIWRFPYLAGENGGAIFLLIYLACIVLLCLPVMIGEITIGRYSGADAVTTFEKTGGKAWKWLGLYGIVTAVFILSFYCVISGWALEYFVQIAFGNRLAESQGDGAPASLSVTLLYTFIFVALTAWVAIRGINKGIERANRILMPALFIILFGLIFYSLTLPNAWAGLTFYLVPDFGELKPQTIFNGLKQSFFSLSLGTGTLLIFGSYLSKKENVISSSVVIALADTSVAFLAGLMIFPFVFSQNMSPAEGPPLVFLVLPKVFFSLGPVWGKIMGALFFLLLCFAALTSTISLIEGPTGYLVDRWKASRSKAVLAIAAATLVLSIPSVLSQGTFPLFSHLGFYQGRDFLTFISDLCDISLVVWGGLMCVVISQRWTTAKLDDELSLGNSGYRSSWVRSYLRVTLTVVCPLILAMLVILIVCDKFVGL